MKGPTTFHVENDFSFSKEDCYNIILVRGRKIGVGSDLEAFSHYPADGSFAVLAFQPSKEIVHSNVGAVKDIDGELGSVIQGFKDLQDVEELPESLINFAKYVLTHYKKPASKQRLQNHLVNALDRYKIENTRNQVTNNILKESYRIHDNLSIVTVDNIIERATSSKGKYIEEGYESDSSRKSEDYHQRSDLVYKKCYNVTILPAMQRLTFIKQN
ncbi:hypothetical protein BDF21DRAFT_473616 [Thamnidium elegans]|nr:hypothetical protein BDF21DRAFT_473616 [Thamnidium elegans]